MLKVEDVFTVAKKENLHWLHKYYIKLGNKYRLIIVEPYRDPYSTHWEYYYELSTLEDKYIYTSPTFEHLTEMIIDLMYTLAIKGYE
jgi:hypothetical protein